MLVNLRQWLPRARTRSRVFRYTGAFVLVSLALLVTLAVPALRYHTPFVLVFPTVILIGAVLGLGPGLLAAVVAAAALLLWVTPAGSNAIPTYWEPIQIVLHMLVACAMIMLIDWLRQAQSRLEAERASLHLAHSQAEQTAARLRKLQAFTAKLSETLTYEQITHVLMTQLLNITGANAAMLAVLNEGGDEFSLIAHSGFPSERLRRWQSFPAIAGLPMGDAARQLELVLLPSHEQAVARYPELTRSETLEHQAWAVVPCVVEGRAIGAVTLNYSAGQDFGPEDQELLLALGRQCGQALERARLYEAELSARQEASAAAHKAELTALRMARLQTVTAELAAVLTRAQVVDVILRNRDAALNAAALSVKLVSDDGQWLESTDVSNYPEELRASYQRYPVSAPVPMADAVRSGEPVWLESEAVYLERYPHLSKDIRALSLEAAAAIPLMLGERILGGIGISFPTTMSFNLEEREYLVTLASQYAQALDRIRLHEAEQQARVQLEARVRERTAELERSNRELNQFAYVASHDLKAPLRAIEHLANWITQDAGSLLPPDSAGHLAKLRGRVKRMETLLDDLLAYSRAGRVRHPATLVDTRLLVQEILEFLSLPPGFVVELVGPMPTIYTERVPIETVFRNLIQNSYKHHDHPSDGHVCISAQELDHTVVFTVADNGPGIAPQYHERIFEIFQTLKPRDDLEGSGIGLTVVKKIVESRGGSLRLESAEGAGATFFITWPKQAWATNGRRG